MQPLHQKNVCKWQKNAQKVEKNEKKFGGIKKTNYKYSPLLSEIGCKGTTNFGHMQIKMEFFCQKLSKIEENFF